MPRANRLLAFPSQGPVNIEEALMRRIEECVYVILGGVDRAEPVYGYLTQPID